MKTKALFFSILMIPAMAMSSIRVDLSSRKMSPGQIPDGFLSPSRSETLEWGCPIDNELVEADTKAAVLEKLKQECMEQVRTAAQAKRQVAEVYRTSVIAPDIIITKTNDGFKVNGTIFLQTEVAMH